MSSETTKECERLIEHLADAVEGALPKDLQAHLEGCDACRDRVHDAVELADRVREMGDGYVAPIDLEARVLATIDAKASKKIDAKVLTEEMPTPPESMDRPLVAKASDAKATSVVRSIGAYVARRRKSVGAGLALAAAVAIGVIALHPKNKGNSAQVASAPWAGTIDVVVGDEGGVMLVDDKATTPLKKGDHLAAGAHVRTDVRTRARIELDDGSMLVMDRGADLVLEKNENRTARLVSGNVVLDASPAKEGGAEAKVLLPVGAISTKAAKASLSTAGGNGAKTSIAVAQGLVTGSDDQGHSDTVNAGMGGSIDSGSIRVGSAAGLSSAFGWSELGEADLVDPKMKATGNGGADVPGLGELRARLPGSKDDGDKPLRLAKQSVTVRVAGEIARTEIEETFANDENQVLEGIFRFPLPPDAQIERLALDVDGKMQEGSFVEKDKGQKIWKGVTYNAQPKPVVPQSHEEWIWVPGPWHDPALLEWKSGGRMELKIYPIPAKGSRRVVLAYTQRIAPSAGVRRYVYPLPHFSQAQKSTSIDDFSFDVQVVGQDEKRGVRVEGYELDKTESTPERVHDTFAKKAFTPEGDIVVEYARKDENATATTYAWQPSDGSAAYVAMSLAPVLPRLPDDVARTQVLVVDSSRSMVGERWKRATSVVARVVEEMDPRDRFALLACDVTCTPMSVSAQKPGKQASNDVAKFLAGITPDGASDLVSMTKSAAMFVKGDVSGRKLRVVYVGDGGAVIGARTPAAVEAGVRSALGDDASLTAVSVGLDVDQKSLEAMARGGAGVVVPYVAGESLSSVALDVLEATYGASLKDASLELPTGLEEVAPSKLGSLRAGEQPLVVARMHGNDVGGNVTLRGTLGGKAWSTTFPIAVRATSDAGNAFVPRLFASTSIADLERMEPSEATKQKIVELSKTFAVPSVYTSLIVLESEAMSKAFGVDKQQQVAMWTGNEVAQGTTTEDSSSTTPGGGKSKDASLDKMNAYGDDDGMMGGLATKGGGSMAGPAATATAAPMPKPKMAPPPMAAAKKAAAPDDWPLGGGGGYWQPMRRVWYRTASFSAAGPTTSDLEAKITAARVASLANPDSRDKLADLFGLVSKRDDLTEAGLVLDKWMARDPLDPKGILARADLAAREADRRAALRIETGALDVSPDSVDLADALANVATRSGDTSLACALRVVHAEVRPKDVDGIVRRLACLSQTGEESTASKLLASLDEKTRTTVESKAASLAPIDAAGATGDVVLDATWTAMVPTDLDVALIDPKGVRYAWSSTKNVKVTDPTSTSHEAIAISFANAGSWTIEVTQASSSNDSASDAPAISGTVTLRGIGQTHSFPFVLQGKRADVGRMSITWASRLEPM